MSISLTNFLAKVNNLLDDSISGTTTSDGNTAKTTFVDSDLAKYGDNYFGDPQRLSEWWAYISSTLRPIKDFKADTGTSLVFKAFSAKVVSGTAYQLHRFDRDKKIIACNQALFDGYPYFYKRVEDETTLDGKGGSDNKYEVPSTFSEFPNQIYKKATSGSKYTYTPITDYVATEVGGTRFFYANITDGDDILLVGKTFLSQFTNDASTTELSDGQANTVSLLAASIFYRTLSGVVNAQDSGRFDSLANRFEARWNERKLRDRMPLIMPENLDWGWQSE